MVEARRDITRSPASQPGTREVCRTEAALCLFQNAPGCSLWAADAQRSVPVKGACCSRFPGHGHGAPGREAAAEEAGGKGLGRCHWWAGQLETLVGQEVKQRSGFVVKGLKGDFVHPRKLGCQGHADSLGHQQMPDNQLQNL